MLLSDLDLYLGIKDDQQRFRLWIGDWPKLGDNTGLPSFMLSVQPPEYQHLVWLSTNETGGLASFFHVLLIAFFIAITGIGNH